MPCDVAMVINLGEALRCSLNLSKSSCWFKNILLITFHPVRLVSIDYCTFLNDGIFILGNQQEVFDGFLPLKYTCITYFLHTVLKHALRSLVYGTTIYVLVLFVACMGLL